MTSNGHDFTDTGSLRPELVADFQPFGIEYAPNLNAAAFSLRV